MLVEKPALEAVLDEFSNAELEVAVIGLNHRVADVKIREKFALDSHASSRFLDEILNSGFISEAVVLNTCNRVEVVFAFRKDLFESAKNFIGQVFASVSQTPLSELDSILYCNSGCDAAAHLFRVASGLDSMVIGEPQVLGQLKQSYAVAKEQQATAFMLNRLFNRAFGVAKLVRSETAIGKKAVSVSYAAKELAQQIFGPLDSASVMLIGAGDTGTLAARHLKAAGVKKVFIVNRTLDRAAKLATLVDGIAADFVSLPELLSQADIVIGASALNSSDSVLIDKNLAAASLNKRPGQAQFYIDLAVPRNFDGDIGSLDDAFLYTVDDLQSVVAKNLDSRMLELDRAELLIERETEKFLNWKQSLIIDAQVKELAKVFDDLCFMEVEKTFRRLRKAGFSVSENSELQKAILSLADAIKAKMLHLPIEALKNKKI